MIFSIVAFQSHRLFPVYEYRNIERSPFDIGVAFFIVLLCVFIHLNFYKCYAAIVMLALALNNFADEVWFDPFDVEFVELCVFIPILILGHAWIKIKEFDKYGT